MRTYTEEEVRDLLRRKRGPITYAKFGELLGVSQTYIHQVLSGTSRPGPKILRFLGLSKQTTRSITYFETNGVKK